LASFRAALFFKANRKYGVGPILFDLILNETHNFNNSISQYNIENGSIISDHIRNELPNGTVSGLITNFSLKTGDNSFQDKSQIAFELIESLWRSKELVTVITFFKIYSNALISNISINKEFDTGIALVANFSFQVVNIVKLQQLVAEASVNLENMDSEQNKQSAINIDVGKTNGVIR